MTNPKSASRSLGALLVVLMLIGIAPGHAHSRSKDENVKRLKRGTSETLSAAAAIASETREEAQVRLEKEMKRLEAKLGELKSRAAKAGQEAKARFEQELPTLESKKAELSEKLEGMRSRSGKAWDELATGTQSALKELRESFEKARKQFD